MCNQAVAIILFNNRIVLMGLTQLIDHLYELLVFSGGLTAVIFTDVLQCVIMILGAITLAILSKRTFMHVNHIYSFELHKVEEKN